MIVKVPKYIYKCHYFWYVIRMLAKQTLNKVIKSEYIFDAPLTSQFVAVLFFDGKPVILDLRDDLNLPLLELRKYPDAPLYKANYSSEIWDNAPASLEYAITEEERKYRKNIRPFMLGRALAIPYLKDEIAYFKKCETNIKYKMVSYTGAGIYRQQTESRLRLYDLISETLKNNSKLIWYDRNDHFKGRWPEYDKMREKYLEPKHRDVWCSFENHLNFISQGQYSINVPGICVSQPFRFIDAILVNRATISTKIWVDCWKDFPCNQLPICGYFGTGDWEKAKPMLEQIANLDWNDAFVLEMQKAWYDKYFTGDGMWRNQFNSGAV